MAGGPMRRTQVGGQLASSAKTPAKLEECHCGRYRFALRYIAVAVAGKYGGSVRVTECPARGYHLFGEPSPYAFGSAGVGTFR